MDEQRHSTEGNQRFLGAFDTVGGIQAALWRVFTAYTSSSATALTPLQLDRSQYTKMLGVCYIRCRS